MRPLLKSIQDLRFDNAFIRKLPGDPEKETFVRQVRKAAYSLVSPTPVKDPKLLSASPEALSELGLDGRVVEDSHFTEAMAGNVKINSTAESFACCYGGHQFGNWAGQLGDGRAISLGEVLGEEGQRWELQLKGSGLTPYSRHADGRAVLRSSVREYLCSEAMYHLGIPTTRALSLVSSSDKVWRDMFYDGRPEQEPCAIVCRMARSFLRFGSFEIFASRNEVDQLRQLADFAIEYHFPHLVESGQINEEVYNKFFQEVVKSTAEVVAGWQCVGFVHGVLNTDNMSILGLTIDFGPFAFLDRTDFNFTPNTSDNMGRYRYANQPGIGLWNLVRFANALTPLVKPETLSESLKAYEIHYAAAFYPKMLKKIGLESPVDSKGEVSEKDSDFVNELLEAMDDEAVDFTIFFSTLSEITKTIHSLGSVDGSKITLDTIAPAEVRTKYSTRPLSAPCSPSRLDNWLLSYGQRLASEVDGSSESDRAAIFSKRLELMSSNNPRVILRNYLAQQAIEKAEEGDFTEIKMLFDALRDPFNSTGRLDTEEYKRFTEMPPEWAKRRGVVQLSCSS